MLSYEQYYIKHVICVVLFLDCDVSCIVLYKDICDIVCVVLYEYWVVSCSVLYKDCDIVCVML